MGIRRQVGRRRVQWRRTSAVLLALSLPVLGPAAATGLAAAVQQSSPVLVGAVMDEAGAAVEGALVRVVGSDRRAVTDEGGRFELRVGAGRHHLEVTRYGYSPAVVSVDWPAAASTRLEVRLRPTPLALPEVLVTASPTAVSATETTRAVSQLSGRALERRLSGSVAETLAGEPGVAVRWNGPGAAAPIVRGLSGDRVVVLQDGQRAADLSGSADDHRLTIDPLLARRIEVVRGPAALLYGNNALGGVVNVVTDEYGTHGPERAMYAFALQSESAYPGLAAHARAGAPVGGWSTGVRATARSTGDVRIAATPGLGARLDNTHVRSAGLGASLGRAGTRVSGTAALYAQRFEYGLPLPPDDDETLTLRGRSTAASARLEAGLGVARFPSLRAAASYTDYFHDEREAGAVEMAFALRTALADAQVRQAAGDVLGEGAWGVSVSWRDYVSTGEEQLTSPAGLVSVGAFTYQELPLGRVLALEAGGRVDHQRVASRDDPRFGAGERLSFAAWSGSVGVRAGRGALSAALSASRSFRAPSVEELFSDALHAGTAAYEIGDASLGPETLRGVDAVLRWRDAHLSAALAAYAAHVADYVALLPRGDTIIDGERWPVLVYAQRGARLRGVEAALDVALTPRLIATLRGDAGLVTLDGGTPLPFAPARRVGGSLRWQDARFSVGVGARHAFARERTAGGADVPTHAHTLVDGDAGLRLPFAGGEQTLTLRVTNASNVAYRDPTSRIKWFAPNPGRNVALLWRVHF
jgi:iron complex outermembrane recepter protein